MEGIKDGMVALSLAKTKRVLNAEKQSKGRMMVDAFFVENVFIIVIALAVVIGILGILVTIE